METLGHFFSSLLNMIGFTSEPSADSLSKSESKESNSSSSEKKEENKEESKKDETQDTNKKKESEETFTGIDIFEDERDKLHQNVHDIFTTSF